MKMNRWGWGLLLLIGLTACCVVLLAGAWEQVKRGNGFLWIPSLTWTASPSPTETRTATPTPSASPTALPASPTPTSIPTATATPSPSVSPTIIPTATVTPSPSVSPTAIPTLDKTVFAAEVFADLTRTAVSFVLSQTPAPTAVIADTDLTTGLYKKNPTDNKTLIYIQNADALRFGYWVDLSVVTAEEYNACVTADACSPIKTDAYSKNADALIQKSPAVNLTRAQASSYCEWVGMNLFSASDWYIAMETFSLQDGDPDLQLTGYVWEWTSDLSGRILGGSRKSGKWDLSHHRYEAQMDPDSGAEDVGFRCAADVLKP